MHSAGFKPTLPAGERPQTHDLDRAATGTGCNTVYIVHNIGEIGHIILNLGLEELQRMPDDVL